MEKPTKRKAFNFLRSYFDVVNELQNDTDKYNFLMAIINKQFLDEDPKDLSFIVNLCYSSQKHSIEASVKGWKRVSNTDMEGNPTTNPPTNPPTLLPIHPPTNPQEVEVEEEVKEEININMVECNDVTIFKEVNKSIFLKPDVLEIKQYCFSRGNNVDAETFFDFYESKGWLIGKSKMKDWRASVRTWERSSINNKKSKEENFDQLLELTNSIRNQQ